MIRKMKLTISPWIQDASKRNARYRSDAGSGIAIS